MSCVTLTETLPPWCKPYYPLSGNDDLIMEQYEASERDYVNGLESIRKRIADIQSDLQECEQDFPAYVTEPGWTESVYRFTSCLEVSGLPLPYGFGLKVTILNGQLFYIQVYG